MNKYKEFKEKQSKLLNKLPLHFAFGKKQFNELLVELNLTQDNYKKFLCQTSNGAIWLKSDIHLRTEWIENYDKEYSELKKNPSFMYEAFLYEMNNHEFGYTRNPEQTLEALFLTEAEVNNNKELLFQFKKARKECFKIFDLNN